MSQLAETPRFKCEGCGKSYGWKAELSNKRVKCKCGHAMTVPDLAAPPPPPEPEPALDPDAPPSLSDDGIYDMIDAAPPLAPPRAAVAIAAPLGAVAKPASAKPAKAGGPPVRKAQPLGYRGGPTPRDRQRADAIHDLRRDVYLPAGLVVGSFLVYMAWLLIHGGAGSTASVGVFAAVMAAIFLVKTLFMVGAAFIVAPMAGVSFGPLWTAILKLAAVSMAPDVFASILEDLIHVQGGGIMASALALGFYWFLMSLLFQFDANEAWTVVVYFAVLRWILSIVIAMFVIGMLFTGAAASIAGGGGGSAGTSLSSIVADTDAAIEDAKDNNGLMLANELIAKGKQTGMQSHIDAFRAAGAIEVWFSVEHDINGKVEPDELIVQWPTDSAARKSLLAAFESYRTTATHKTTPFTDNGGKYMELPLASK